MLLTIFAKKRTTAQGKPFYTFLTQLTRKTGETETAQVKFPQNLAPSVEDCPLNIEIDKTKANLSTKKVNTDRGEVISRTLWVKDYAVADIPFEDKSLDDYE